MAPRIASVLYGVIAIMTVDLAVQPDRLRYAEAVLGVLLIGLAMAVTRLFVRVVTKEAEIGKHLPMRESATFLLESLLVMLFPGTTAVVILLAALTTTRWPILLDAILYFGVAAVFVIGFSSSYVLDRNIRLGLARGAAWVLMALALVAVKKLAQEFA
jgi:putative effector of murein hydrolase LrgA (UPF0299 family)